ncbi:MAG: hypothetical protein A3D92_08380 [Bacteroidetes bacterium RIFCSPHIGHO2_02_FULL_44_7]|nr:MAG: hypothetical protein A3D92_08380 [Bacteroidetes bacterium RIFCSPHIGHO2_02_FULL_44_7]
MSKQTCRAVLMIEPSCFGFNEESFATNSFQHRSEEDLEDIQDRAQIEFLAFVDALNEHGVDVHHYTDLPDSTTPDSIFPNNWFSTHGEGKLCLYPMAVPNRRAERRADIIEDLLEEGLTLKDFTAWESTEQYLEGTGSMVFDHDARLIYAALSPRTHLDVLNAVAKELDYTAVPFQAYGAGGELIYHTNVLLCVGENFIAVGMDTVDEADRASLLETMNATGKTIIFLSNEQVYQHFAGNMLQVRSILDERILVMSSKAFESLNAEQKAVLGANNEHLLPISIPTIEHIGGGSVRCMMAELFFGEE